MQRKLWIAEEPEKKEAEEPSDNNIICARCNTKVYVFNILRLSGVPSNLCGACTQNLKKYFEKKNDTFGKDIRLCSCCRKFKEIDYVGLQTRLKQD